MEPSWQKEGLNHIGSREDRTIWVEGRIEPSRQKGGWNNKGSREDRTI